MDCFEKWSLRVARDRMTRDSRAHYRRKVAKRSRAFLTSVCCAIFRPSVSQSARKMHGDISVSLSSRRELGGNYPPPPSPSSHKRARARLCLALFFSFLPALSQPDPDLRLRWRCERANFARKSRRPKKRFRGPPRSRQRQQWGSTIARGGSREQSGQEGDRSTRWRWT